jgi:Ti-type conjugative transfer relaxase TraA
VFHFRTKIIGRSGGRSAGGAVAYRAGSQIAAASIAYRAGEKLTDPNSGRSFDYRAKGRLDANGYGVLYREILAPVNAPAWVYDLQSLVNQVEAAEKRKDAQLFRELEVSLPRELGLEQWKGLLRAFVERMCVRAGMIAAIFIHNEKASDGGDNPHAHILLTMRDIGPDGFGQKRREWNATKRVQDWREAWAEYGNEYLLAHGHAPRLDHRSHKDRDLDVEPDSYVGPTQTKAFDGVLVAHRESIRAEGKARNLERAATEPAWVLEQITRTQSTFTEADVARFIHRYTALTRQDDRFAPLLAAVMQSKALQELAKPEGQKPARYTTRAMLDLEAGMIASAVRLTLRKSATVSDYVLTELTPEQANAANAILTGSDLAVIHGLAGTGKTHLLADVAAKFQSAGHRVRGTALSAIVARNLGEGANINAQTLASLLKDLDRDRPYEPLRRGDVLILDEAGMVGSRQMGRLLDHADRAGAKVILVGDSRQLQSIEAGGAFKTLAEKFEAKTLTTIQRQRIAWQREATKDLATGKVAEALAAYRAQGHLHASSTPTDAMEALVEKWAIEGGLGEAQLIVAHRRSEAQTLNRLARQALRNQGRLGRDVTVEIASIEEENGEAVEKRVKRQFALGDRLLFTKNDRGLGVQNGALGTVTSLTPSGEFWVRLDDGREVIFDVAEYRHFEQGYALTVHKAQGATVDRTYVLAGEMMDAHLAYVALTRHRKRVDLFYNRVDFPTDAKLMRALARDRTKDTTIDYRPRIVVEADLPETENWCGTFETLGQKPREIVREIPWSPRAESERGLGD